SREPLRVAGEAVYAVPALEVPPPGGPVDAASVTRYAAATLFVERAAARSGFRIDEASASAVADICRRHAAAADAAGDDRLEPRAALGRGARPAAPPLGVLRRMDARSGRGRRHRPG